MECSTSLSAEVLLMHGGGHSMFAAVPLNLAGEMGAPVDFIGDGFWSKRAASEVGRTSSSTLA